MRLLQLGAITAMQSPFHEPIYNIFDRLLKFKYFKPLFKKRLLTFAIKQEKKVPSFWSNINDQKQALCILLRAQLKAYKSRANCNFSLHYISCLYLIGQTMSEKIISIKLYITLLKFFLHSKYCRILQIKKLTKNWGPVVMAQYLLTYQIGFRP